MEAKNEIAAPYLAADDQIIAQALGILESRMRRLGPSCTSPNAVRDYLRLTLTNKESEEFWCIWTDAQNRVIAPERMFTGTLTQCSVYPRELAKRAMQLNAAGVILAHNHPSGVAEPSHADETLTRAIREALALVDCRVLDHIVVGANSALSFAERGLL